MASLARETGVPTITNAGGALSLPLGVPWTNPMLDTARADRGLGDNSYIFRFKGGAPDIQRRERRARFIAGVLQHYGLKVDRRQDLWNAGIKKLPQEPVEELLAMLGRLRGCSRQLDVTMDTDTRVGACMDDARFPGFHVG